ncbi:hypothetical protein QQF64_033548 [Cirrhinus molitorella]|uniref:Uncharacterized protein n=1 Tax=Cirrhinus molitorella TaxID=172907 RepID=A0ABR3MU72_9TELE
MLSDGNGRKENGASEHQGEERAFWMGLYKPIRLSEVNPVLHVCLARAASRNNPLTLTPRKLSSRRDRLKIPEDKTNSTQDRRQREGARGKALDRRGNIRR